MAFRVGQKVVCVTKMHSMHPGLNVGRVYTVAGIEHQPHWQTPGVLLVEIAPRLHYTSFESLLFRPAVETKTNISIFTKMLTGSEHEAVS